jgi:hypothetical protein
VGRTSGRRPRPARRLPLGLLAAAALVAASAGCGGGGSAASTTTTTAAPPSVLGSTARAVTFANLRTAIDRLYAEQPGIRTFVARDVEYSPKTRDKVLDVCRRGGPETDASARESSKIAGCAPLVFFFYSYGHAKSAPQSIDVARQVYWYAATNIRGPFDARTALTTLLRSWGIP